MRTAYASPDACSNRPMMKSGLQIVSDHIHEPDCPKQIQLHVDVGNSTTGTITMRNAGPIPIAWKLMTSEPRSFRVTGPTGPPMGHLEPAGHASIQLDYLPVPMSVPTQPCTGKFLLQAVAYKGKEPAVLDHAWFNAIAKSAKVKVDDQKFIGVFDRLVHSHSRSCEHTSLLMSDLDRVFSEMCVKTCAPDQCECTHLATAAVTTLDALTPDDAADWEQVEIAFNDARDRVLGLGPVLMPQLKEDCCEPNHGHSHGQGRHVTKRV